MANRNFASQKLFTGHVMPVQIDCEFTVAATDTGGLGLTGLTGAYISNVYMYTSATPATGSPAPVAGTIVVRLQDIYTHLYNMQWSIQSQNSGSAIKIDNSAMTTGTAYVITTLGNSTTTKWHTIGVPAGVTPAVGVAFIAASNGGSANTSTSRVQIAAAAGSGVASIEIVGNSNLSISPAPSANQGYGAQIILQCRDFAGALVAPTDGCKIQLKFLLSNSSVTINGS